MNSLITCINSLPSLKYSGGVSADEVNKAEQSVGVKFSDDFKLYLMNFGQLQARGIELTGISSKTSTSVVRITKDEFERESFSHEYYVIEDLGIDGILYLQNRKGQVFEYCPGKAPKLYADSLVNYIKLSQR